MRLDGRKGQPTLVGMVAILLWAMLALLTELSGAIPAFQLTALSFTIASGVGIAVCLKAGGSLLEYLKLPAGVWALGVVGLFGYHFFYFVALQNAPAVEASLIAYLWPLFIVLFSSLLPGERLRWFHCAGAVLSFVGVGVLVTKGQSLAFDARYTTGYLAAFLCAIIWSSYSVLSRRFGDVPTQSVAGFCGATAGLSWLCHFLFETTVVPSGVEWLAVLGLGIGPVGLAFFAWDYGVKRGDIQMLGILSYATPFLSTILLSVFGLASLTWTVWVACFLIAGGALLSVANSLL